MIWAITSTILFVLSSAFMVEGAQRPRPGAGFYVLFFVWLWLAVACGEAWQNVGA